MKKILKYILIMFIVISITGCSEKESSFKLETIDDNTVSAILNNVNEGSSINGTITINDNKKLIITTDFVDESKVEIKLFNQNKEQVLDEEVKGINNYEYEFDNGEYEIYLETKKYSDGKILIEIK